MSCLTVLLNSCSLYSSIRKSLQGKLMPLYQRHFMVRPMAMNRNKKRGGGYITNKSLYLIHLHSVGFKHLTLTLIYLKFHLMGHRFLYLMYLLSVFCLVLIRLKTYLTTSQSMFMRSFEKDLFAHFKCASLQSPHKWCNLPRYYYFSVIALEAEVFILINKSGYTI